MTPDVKQRIEQFRREELPEGYKKTSLGIVPANWIETTLGEIYTERNEPGNNDLPLLMVSIHSGVSDGKVDEEDLPKKVKRIEDKSQYKHAMPGDLVFNMMRAWQGAIGSVRTEGMVSPAYIVAAPNDLADPVFMDYYMKTPRMINMLHRQSYGVTDFRLRLYWDSFSPIPCVLPSIAEQRQIAEILVTQDKLIKVEQERVSALKKLKQAYMSKMFPKEGSIVPELRFGGYADVWEQRKLGEVFDFLQNNTLSKADLSTECGAAKNIHYGDVLINFGEYLDVSKSALPYIPSQQIADKYKSSWLKDGDIIMADTAEDEAVGKCSEIAGLHGLPTISGLHTIPMRPVQKYAPGYLGYYLNSAAYHDQLLPLMQGIKVTSVSRSAIQDTVVAYPADIAEQEAIGQYFIQLDSLIILHQRKVELQQKKKYALMELLLTGILKSIKE